MAICGQRYLHQCVLTDVVLMHIAFGDHRELMGGNHKAIRVAERIGASSLAYGAPGLSESTELALGEGAVADDVVRMASHNCRVSQLKGAGDTVAPSVPGESTKPRLVDPKRRSEPRRHIPIIRIGNEAVDVSDISSHVPHRDSSLESRLIAREQLNLVWDSVARLSERQRQIFLLRFLEELELTEIASITGLPISTVKTHLYRALATIRAHHNAFQKDSL